MLVELDEPVELLVDVVGGVVDDPGAPWPELFVGETGIAAAVAEKPNINIVANKKIS